MATITTGANSGRSLSLDVWETGSYDSGASTRQYGWKLYGSGGGSGWVQSGNFKALVAGNQVYYSSTRINLYNGTVVAEGTVWVQHDNAGNKYVDMYCEAGIYTVAVNVSASGGFWGSNIPRYANITSHSISHVGINKVGVSWGTDVGVDWLQYSLNGAGWTDVGGNPYYVGGLTPNTAYNIRSRVRRTDSGLWTESGYLYFTTVENGVITGANDFTDESNGYMTYRNNWGNNVQELVGGLYWNGSEALRAYAAISKTGTDYTFSLTEAERSAIRSRMANVNSMDILYYIRTQSENLYHYSNITKKITIVNAKPVINGFNYQDTNAVTTALTGSDQKIIKGKSNLRVHTITATSLKSATKKTVIVDGVGATWSDTYEKTINAYSKNTIGVSMTDSRDNTSDVMTKTFATYIDYFDITKGEQSALRSTNGVGENVTLVAKGTWFNNTFGSVVNTLTASYRYKKTGSSTWITGTTSLTVNKTLNNFTINQDIIGNIATGFSVEDSFDLEVIFTDKLSTVTFQYTVLAGSPAIAIIGNKVALGGKFDEASSNVIQIRKTAEIIEELISNSGYMSKYRGFIGDFNNCLTEGVYNASSGTSLTNAPYTGGIFGKLLVYVNTATTHNNSNNWIWQTFMDTGGRVFKRYKVNSGAWTSWVDDRLIAYPVGTVIIRNDTIDPATLFGGTWAAYPDDYYLMSSTNDTPGSLIAGSTSTGSTAISEAQMPGHGHSYMSGRWVYAETAGGGDVICNQSGTSYFFTRWTGATGGNQGHSHSISTLQMPAINVRVWRRTT